MKKILELAPTKLRALVLLMRYSGLRIKDAVSITEDKVKDGRVFLYTSKTGTPVSVPLPPFVVKELEQTRAGGFYFWTGIGDKDTCAKNWQREFRKLSTKAKFKVHAHRLRDTFSVELLRKGVSVENVAAVLGNSPAIVMKHYAPWIEARQVALDAAVKRTW